MSKSMMGLDHPDFHNLPGTNKKIVFTEEASAQTTPG